MVRIFSWYVTYRERYGSAIGQGDVWGEVWGDGGNSDVPSSSTENRAVVRIFSWYVTCGGRYGSAVGQDEQL